MVRGACPHDCPDTCAMLVTVTDGVVTGVKGDPDHPFTAGALCPKVHDYEAPGQQPRARAAPAPARRAQGRGSLRAHLLGRRAGRDRRALRRDRARARVRGDPPVQLPRRARDAQRPRGRRPVLPPPRRVGERADLLRLRLLDRVPDDGRADGRDRPGELRPLALHRHLGLQPHEHEHPHVEVRRRGAAARGEGRRHRSAAHAHGQARRLAHRDPARHRRGARARHGARHRRATGSSTRSTCASTRSVSTSSPSACADYPPERVAQITGVPAADIERLATEYATTQPAAIRVGVAVERHASGGQAVRAITSLPALTGAWRNVGGGILQLSHWAFPLNIGALHRPDWIRPGTRVVNQWQLGAALTGELELDPPVQGAVRLQRQPRDRRLRPGADARRPRARGPVHGRRRAVHDRHRALRGHRPAQHDAGRAARPRVLVGPDVPHAEHAGRRAARRGRVQPRDVRAARAAHGLRRPALHDVRRGRAARGDALVAPVAGGHHARVPEGDRLGAAQHPVAPTSTPRTRTGGFPTPSGRVELKASMAEGGDFVVSVFREGYDEHQSGADRRPAAALARAGRAAQRHVPAADDLAQGARVPELDVRQRRPPTAAHARASRRRSSTRPTRRRAASPRATRSPSAASAASCARRRSSPRTSRPASSCARWATGSARPRATRRSTP